MHSERSIQDYLDVVKQGIAKKFGDGKPKTVVIVGAGLAGLVAGYELARSPDHSRPNSAGGRVTRCVIHEACGKARCVFPALIG
jgi:threonine dehydrogenase-like Zn-dependent dehydrogenase